MKNLFIASLLLLSTACSHREPAAEGKGYAGHGQDSVTAETIKKYAPAALPADISSRVQSLLDVRAPSTGMLTPDRKRMFFNWNVTGVNQVWRLDGPQAFPVQMTGGRDRTTLVGMSIDGKTIFLSRDRDGDEYFGIYAQSVDGGQLREIFRKEKAQAELQLISEDGKTIFYRVNDIDPKNFALYRYDLTTGQRELVLNEPGMWGVEDEARGKILVMQAVTNTAAEVWEIDLATKKRTPVIGQGENQAHEVTYGALPGEVLVSTPKLGDFTRLYVLKNGKLTPISPDVKHDVSGFGIERGARKRIAYMLNVDGYTKLNALDARTYKPLFVPAFPDAEHVTVGQLARNGAFAMLGVSKATAPRSSYSYDWNTRKLTQWVIPSQPEIDTKTFTAAKLESYPARDGVKIPMFVRRSKECADPKRAEPCPVVVVFHGGPESQSIPGFSLTAQAFVEKGFIFVEPNVRGSDGYGKKWLDSDNGAKRLDVITDIADASDYIRKAWAVNGKAPKIGVMGGSYGGYSTLYAMTRFAGSYDAGVSNVGMSNLLTFLNNTAPYRRALRTPEYGDPEIDKEALIKLSPSTYLDRVKAPLLVIQGVADPRVPAGEAIQMHEALQAKNIPSELILFPDEGHGASKRENQVLQLGHTLQFFQKHLR